MSPSGPSNNAKGTHDASDPITDARLVVLTDERSLVERIRDGDRGALSAVFQAYATSLHSYAHRITRSRAVASELVQDVFVRIWEIRTEWRVESVGAYLHGAVRRRALNYLRHRSVEDAFERARGAEMLVDGAPAAGAADELVLAHDLATAAERAMERLTPKCREAFVLHRQHHLTYAEIATVLGVTPKAVELQISRALKALRAILAGYLAIVISTSL
jgi:RNA polymerase sigma-70 factor (ECF subfamily)